MTFEGKVDSPLLDRLYDELATDIVVTVDDSFWSDRNVALEVQSWTERSADSDFVRTRVNAPRDF